MNKYIGHPSQLYGIEEHRLVGGKGDGMRLLEVHNATGMAFTLSLDRCADISRLSLGGVNYGYFAPCGYVAPTYYDGVGFGFLKSFTAGFLTTCGLTTIGAPCVDEGEELPQHGTASHLPCEQVCYFTEGDVMYIRVTVRDARLFGHKLLLEREYACSIYENVIHLTDRIRNVGSADCPVQVLYHCNLGYPLLDEHLQLAIPSQEVGGFTPYAEQHVADWERMEKPQRGYQEMCFFHRMTDRVTVTAKNPACGRGLAISYDTAELPCFTEWKMMGEYDYVLGLEPGNSLPEGRATSRAKGCLQMLPPDECITHHITFTLTEE